VLRIRGRALPASAAAAVSASWSGPLAYGDATPRRPGLSSLWRMIAPDTPPKETQTLIDAHVNALNSQNVELFLSVFAHDAVIIDGIAPYRWLNPNSPAHWLAEVEKWRKDLGSPMSACPMRCGSGTSRATMPTR
jgi:hypothetical protein